MSLIKVKGSSITGALAAVDGSALTGVSGGKILQVTKNTITGESNVSSTSYEATNIHHNITPSATTSKVLVLIALPSLYHSTSNGGRIMISRHTAVVGTGGSHSGTEVNNDDMSAYQGSSSIQTGKSAYMFLDSPSSTSAVYYQVYIRNRISDGVFYLGQGGTPKADITLIEVGA